MSIVKLFTDQGYSAPMVASALKATTFRQCGVQMVLDSLVGHRGIPDGTRGVWTEKDDRLLRRIEGPVDPLQGKLPDSKDRSLSGNFDGEDGWWAFWRLVRKHGGEGVFERREFLRVWDRV
jgi:hypothetical protein